VLTYKELKVYVFQGGTKMEHCKWLIYIGLGGQLDSVVGVGHVNLGFGVWDLKGGTILF
jgi:hypothetical protein